MTATILVVASLSGCAMVPSGQLSAANGDSATSGSVAEQPEGGTGQVAFATLIEKSEPLLLKGTDQMANLPTPKPPILLLGEDVSLNFEQAPLIEVVHSILGDTLGLDYIVEHPIKGQVTLRTRTPVPRDQLLKILESLLQSNKAVIVRDKNDRYYVSGSGQMAKRLPGISAAGTGDAGFSTVVIPLAYISASEMAAILKPLADDSAFVRVDSARNLLMLAGTRLQLDGWMEIIATFDIDLLEGMSVGVFPLSYATAEDIEAALASVLGTDEGANGKKRGSTAGLIQIIPVDRLNSILVVTPRAEYLDKVKIWIDRLDREPDANFEQRLYVYPVQNTTATRLADLLSSIYAGGNGSRSTAGRAAGVAPGLTPERVSSAGNNSASNKRKGAKASGMTGASQNTRNTGYSSNNSSGYSADNLRVVADEENNSLLIYATGREYKKIESALKQLDVVATQIIIEASILEVTLTDGLEYGLEWNFRAGLGSNYGGAGGLATGSGAPGAQRPGFSYSVTNGAGNISAVLNALSEKTLINVISTPSIMVLDNFTAEIQVGDQVPVRSSSSVSETGNVLTSSVEFRDTGVRLSVTPSVNAGGMVTMDIEQSVTDVGQIDTATGQRSFLERSISSRIAVRSSESVVLGGLIKENNTRGKSGVPFLHTIPGIGSLFGKTDNEVQRTELLVIITPRVIFNEDELREVSQEMRARMSDFELININDGHQLLRVED